MFLVYLEAKIFVFMFRLSILDKLNLTIKKGEGGSIKLQISRLNKTICLLILEVKVQNSGMWFVLSRCWRPYHYPCDE